MREKRPVTSMVTFLSGITPASAGKTLQGRGSVPALEDHPRECGKNTKQSGNRHWLPGSPPRVREKQGYAWIDEKGNRITPASAGKTKRRIAKCHTKQDHPRECGKNCIVVFVFLQRSRITPASAGKTSTLNQFGSG